MFRSHGLPRVLGASALVLCAIASATSSEAPPAAFKQDPRSAQRAAAAKRAPHGTAVPAERYLAAGAHVADMPSYSTAAPSPDSAATVVGTWANLGPSDVGGRTRALVVQPGAPDTWYGAGVAGGVFKTTDAALTPWAALGDTMANMAVSALAMKPGTPTTLLAGTGEGFFNEDLVRGAGIFQSLNGGTTWTQVASTNNANFHYVNDLAWSTNPPYNNVYAATDTGVFRSINSGASWTQILAPSLLGGCLDLSLAPGAGDFILASCGTFTTAKVYRTQGTTAASIASWTEELTEADMGRTSLSETTSTGIVYALASNRFDHKLHAVFRSDDGGLTWVRKADSASAAPSNLILQNAYAKLCYGVDDAFGWYANTIAIDPSDPSGNTVWSGSIDVYRSPDGGLTWSPMSSWWEEGMPYHVPSGQHAFAFRTGGLLVAGDGGIFQLTTAPSGPGDFATCPGGTLTTAQFSPRNYGYAVTQFNSAAVAPSDTTYIGGTQRGTLLGTDTAGSLGWSRIWADYGGAAAIDPTDPDVIYLVGPGGMVRKSLDGGASFPAHSTGLGGYWSEGLSGNFASQPAFAIDPTNPHRLWIAGEDRIFRSDDGAFSWQPASASLAIGATAIAISPANPEVVTIGSADGRVWRTTAASSTDGSTIWLVGVAPRLGYVSSLAFDPLDPNLVYLTYATFGGVHLWKSPNGGATWADADGAGATGIPDVPVHSVVVDPTNAARIYAGTDVGVFVSLNRGTTWAKENTLFPNVITERLVASGANLYAFTHGRGAWRVPLTNTGTPTTTVGFFAPRTTVTEQGVAVDVDVVLSTANHLPLAGPVTVAYASVSGSAGAGSDFTLVSGTLTFPVGSTHGSTQKITVTILEDGVGEPLETFALNLSAPTGGALLALPTHIVALEDDADPPGLSVRNVEVSEGTASVTITVNLTAPLTVPVTVNYATENGTAVEGTTGDYTATSGLLTFPAGATVKTVLVSVKPDTLAEPAETFSLRLSGATGSAIVDDLGVVTINDNDLSGSLQFSAATYAVAESGLKATVTVTRTGGAASGVTVQYATNNGTAVAPGDYTPVSGTLTFAANSASQTFQVTILNDTLDESDETVSLQLLNPVGHGAILGAPSTAALSITDNDAGGEMAFSAATYAANEGTSVLITVKRTGGTASGVSVDYATISGSSATSPADYALTAGTLAFASGETQKTFSVPLVAESPSLPEGEETFQVVLSNPQGGATISGTLGTAIVRIADASPRVSFQAVATTVNESLTKVTLNVARAGPLGTAVTVQYASADGTATVAPLGSNPADYTAASGSLVIPAGATSKAITVTLKTDTLVEGPESFTVSLGTVTGGILGANATTTVNITDNDLGGAIAFSAPTVNANEPLSGVLPAKATVTVKRTVGLASGVTVHWSTADGTALAPADYTGASGTITFDAGVTTKTFTVDVLPDAEVEGYESVNLILDTPTGGASLGGPSAAAITVIDSEPVVQFTPAAVTVGEAGPKATFTVRRTGSLAGALTVFIVDLGGTATAGVGGDYNNVPLSLVMPANAASKTFTVDILQDALRENTELVNLGLASCAPGCTVGPLASAVLSITDDEPLVSFSAATYAVTEGTAKVTLTLKRTGSTVAALTVGIGVTGGTATGGGVDYNNVPATVLIPAKASTKTFTIDIVNDLLGEAGETIGLEINSVTVGGFIGTLPTTVVNLADNEPTIAFSLASYAISEPPNTGSAPGKLTVAVKRTGTLTQVSTVTYQITNGTATAGSDYNPFPPAALSGTLTFAAGAASVNLVIDIVADLVDEPNETFQLSLSSPTSAKLGANVIATATITDNDL